MAVLVVSSNKNFSGSSLANMEAVWFTNGSSSLSGVTATFAASQFNDLAIRDDVLFVGSAGVNVVQVNGGSVDASAWRFSRWDGRDRVGLAGSVGDDTIVGSVQSDTVVGNAGDDVITGGLGADTLRGGEGDDVFVYGNVFDLPAAESIDGGAGVDTLRIGEYVNAHLATIVGVERLEFTVAVAAYLTGAQIGPSGIDTVVGTGSMFDRLLVVNSANIDLGAVTFQSWNGFIELFGTAGADRVVGSSQSDILFGSGGADVLVGGAGQDRADYRDSPSGVIVNLLTGKGVGGHAAGDTLAGIEDVNGSGVADTLGGNAARNVLWGGGGADALNGGGGDDVLEGESGTDRLRGGLGLDRLTGGGDNDTFVFASRNDTPAFTGGVLSGDLLLDFQDDGTGAGGATSPFNDVIDLSAIDANEHVAGDQAFFLDDRNSVFSVREIVFENRNNALGVLVTVLLGFTNGDQVADFAIEFDRVLAAPGTEDFVL